MFTSRPTRGLDSLINRPHPTKWQQFLHQPSLYLACQFHQLRTIPPLKPSEPSITIICISDTHNTKPEIPPGEILIHAGDATQLGTLQEFQATIDWLDTFPHRHKILIGGNHDSLLDSKFKSQDPVAIKSINWRSIIYLEKEAVTLCCTGDRQLRVYGSPLTPKYGNWAFQHPQTEDVWRGIVPLDTDILVTHGPPKGHLDLGKGCEFLLREIWRVKPKLHVFGHIHEGYGQEWVRFDDQQKVFEEIIRDDGGVRKLLLLLYKSIAAWFTTRTGSSTLLVNAAVLGGIRDEKKKLPSVVTL